MEKILQKIFNILKKLNIRKKVKKKRYSLDSLLRIYEEIFNAEESERQERENIKSENVRYIYIHEPCEYYLNSKPQPPEKKLQFYREIDWRKSL